MRCGARVELRLHPADQFLEGVGIRPRHAGRRHHPGPHFPHDLLGDIPMIPETREIDLVQQQVRRFQFFVVADDAVLIEDGALRGHFRGRGRSSDCDRSLRCGGCCLGAWARGCAPAAGCGGGADCPATKTTDTKARQPVRRLTGTLLYKDSSARAVNPRALARQIIVANFTNGLLLYTKWGPKVNELTLLNRYRAACCAVSAHLASRENGALFTIPNTTGENRLLLVGRGPPNRLMSIRPTRFCHVPQYPVYDDRLL